MTNSIIITKKSKCKQIKMNKYKILIKQAFFKMFGKNINQYRKQRLKFGIMQNTN